MLTEAAVLSPENLGRNLVGGEWIDADSGHVASVRDPATGGVIGTVPRLGAAEVERAVQAAAAALPIWSVKPALERSKILRRWHELVTEYRSELAELLSREQGKPLSEAGREIDQARSFLDWFAEEAKRGYGDIIPSDRSDRRMSVIRQPVGVVAAITPWNFPAGMVARKLAPAVAAGCTVVLKPAEETPFSAIALAALGEKAGLPAGVINVVTGDARTVGRVLTESPLVRKLTFTGSTRIGKILAEQCVPTMKRLSLELGGNAPLIVFDDADLDLAVMGTLASRFRNAGQTCVAANRIFVHENVHDEFVERLSERVSHLATGNGLNDDVDLGPLINASAVEGVEKLLDSAKLAGAKVLTGGETGTGPGHFFTPAVVVGVTDDMEIATEEIFGPVASILRFATEDEVVSRANSTPYGLAAYVYTENHRRMVRVSEALEFGMVGLNESLVAYEGAPFGGVKESGYGREGSRYGLDDYTDLKYVCTGGLQ